MKPSRFKLLFAYRNIKSNRKSSLVIILTLSLLFCLMILMLGMKPIFSKVYELQAIDNYSHIDIVMTYDEYSSSRLINKREVKEEYEEYIHYSMSFFNLDVLSGTEELYYAKMLSSLPHEFEYLVDEDVLILENEIIITKSLSNNYKLEVGDTFEFDIFDNKLEYIIGDVFEDSGLFSGNTFYIDKEELLEQVYGLNLTNFGNTLYIDIEEQYNADEVIDILESNENFSDYNIFPTVDWTYIDSKAMDLVSMMLALGIIVILAVFMVLDSLFPIISKDITQQQGVVSVLGGEKRFIWHVSLIQWLVYSVIAFIIGIILALFVVNLGMYVYGIEGYIPLKFLPTILSLLFILAYIIIRAYISYYREYKKSSITLTKNVRYKKYRTKEINMIVAAILLLLEYYFVFFRIEIHSLIIVALSIYLAFNVLSYLIIIISRFIRKTKTKSLFSIFQMKYLENNKHLHQSLRVLMICLITLVMIFSLRVFLYSEIDEFYELMEYDITVANVHDYEESLLNEIKEYDITAVDESVFYQNIYIEFQNGSSEPCKFFVSIEHNNLTKYFKVNEIDFDESYLSNDSIYVLLPKNYSLVYNINVGDTVKLDLNYALKDIEVEVAGFLDVNFDNLIYSNIMFVSGYEDLAIPNSLFLNSDNKEEVYNDLIRDYSGDMYYILDPNVYFDEMVQGAVNMTEFFTVLTSFMIICFVIVIFNNTLLIFYSLKTEIAKIKVLGASRNDFIITLLKEYFFILVIILGVGLIEITILSKNLKYVVLFTNFYKDITSTPLTILFGCVIVSLVLFFSYLYYFININKTNIIDEIKIY